MFSPYGAYPLNRFELTYKLHRRHRYRSASGSFVNQAGAYLVQSYFQDRFLITFAIMGFLYAILILRISTSLLLFSCFYSLFFRHFIPT